MQVAVVQIEGGKIANRVFNPRSYFNEMNLALSTEISVITKLFLFFFDFA